MRIPQRILTLTLLGLISTLWAPPTGAHSHPEARPPKSQTAQRAATSGATIQIGNGEISIDTRGKIRILTPENDVIIASDSTALGKAEDSVSASHSTDT